MDPDSLKIKRGTEILSLRQASYRGWVQRYLYEYNGYYRRADYLTGWQAYWLLAFVDDLELIMDSEKMRKQKPNPEIIANAENWELTIHTSSNGCADNITIGTKEEATDEYDAEWDCFEPPIAINGNIKAYFVKDWKSEFGNKFDTDIINSIPEGETRIWEFIVETQNSKFNNLTTNNQKLKTNLSWRKIPVILFKNQKLKTKNCTITWPSIEGVPEEISITLIDGDKRINLRKNDSYSCKIKGIHKFKIEVTNHGSSSNRKYIWALYGARPNPFIKKTNIYYSLGNKSYVSLKMYDVTGRLVKTLVNKEQKAGYYSIEVGKQDLTSGIYFVKLKSSHFCDTKKLVLLK
jgi:hypothetical protein